MGRKGVKSSKTGGTCELRGMGGKRKVVDKREVGGKKDVRAIEV